MGRRIKNVRSCTKNMRSCTKNMRCFSSKMHRNCFDMSCLDGQLSKLKTNIQAVVSGPTPRLPTNVESSNHAKKRGVSEKPYE